MWISKLWTKLGWLPRLEKYLDIKDDFYIALNNQNLIQLMVTLNTKKLAEIIYFGSLLKNNS